MENTKIWNNLCKPPSTALKTIRHGNLKGMTDINPQWRLKALTEELGPVGVGWTYDIVRTWSEQVGEEILCFVEVALKIKVDGEWSASIPGLGGSKLLQHFSSKGYSASNDEGYKMALTDALSVAMKQLGVAAKIYEGLWDGSKYRDEPDEPQEKKKVTLAEVKTAQYTKYLGGFPNAAEAIKTLSQAREFGNDVHAYLSEFQGYNK